MTAPAVETVRLTLPYDKPPAALYANNRPHWSQRSRQTRMVRADIVVLGHAAGLHKLWGVEHVTVTLTWAPGDRRRRDSDNLWPLLKACADGIARGSRKELIGLELVPDDTPEHMTKMGPVIAPPPAKGMWLDLSIRFAEEPT